VVLDKVDIDIAVRKIEKTVTAKLLQEWDAQGHSMTDKVVNDMHYVIQYISEYIFISGYMYEYGGYIETGTPAENIPFSPGSGNKRSMYIEGLIKYVEKRMGLFDKQAKKVAFAIAHTQKREGMPTRGSFKYSSNGKRTGWIDDSLAKASPDISEIIRKTWKEIIQADFTNLVRNYKT